MQPPNRADSDMRVLYYQGGIDYRHHGADPDKRRDLRQAAELQQEIDEISGVQPMEE